MEGYVSVLLFFFSLQVTAPTSTLERFFSSKFWPRPKFIDSVILLELVLPLILVQPFALVKYTLYE